MKQDTLKRSEIVQQAFQVFFKSGFHAAGVDSLLEGSGISKRTLYKYFKSKEELVTATIELYREETFSTIQSFVEASSEDRLRPLAVFDWLKSIADSGHRYGCFAINAKLEYAHREAKIEAACDAHFEHLEEYLVDVCRAAGYKHAKMLARQILLLVQGTIVVSMTARGGNALKSARSAAANLLEASARELYRS